MTEPGGWVYMMTNRVRGTLYAGISADLIRRVHEHKSGVGGTFTRRYYLRTLVWFEHHDDIRAAIQRETSIKRWPRQWKLELIEKGNPAWEDLYPRLIGS